MASDSVLELIDFRITKKDNNGNLSEQIFGINVYKVKEVIFRPDKINTIPNKSEYIEGMINLRGHVIPIINLQKRLGYATEDMICDYFIITEFNDIVCGFMVHKIMKIRQAKWEDIIAPPEEVKSEYGDLITSMTLIDGKDIMLIIDFEKILSELDESYSQLTQQLEALPSETGSTEKPITVLCIDDSVVARNMMRQTLESAGHNVVEAVNGIDALQKINILINEATAENIMLADKINLILCDIEMPLMDGFTFTKNIKENPNAKGIPVILHSSLSKAILTDRGINVGADDFLTKFNAETLLESVRKYS